MEASTDTEKKRGGRSLWIWVLLAFLILVSAWVALIVIATKNQPEIIEVDTP